MSSTVLFAVTGLLIQSTFIYGMDHFVRFHTEVPDGSGFVRGTFAYADPRNQGRTVDYYADRNGFHPEWNQVEDIEANKRATQRHFELYNQIAAEHANPQFFNQQSVAPHPQQSEEVIRATNRHLYLYNKIAQEHAAIGVARQNHH